MPQTCQMLLFSATFEDTVWSFAERLVPNPNIIKLKKEEMTLDNILQFYDACEDKEAKYNALRNIYGVFTIAQAIVFCRVRLLFTSCFYFNYIHIQNDACLLTLVARVYCRRAVCV